MSPSLSSTHNNVGTIIQTQQQQQQQQQHSQQQQQQQSQQQGPSQQEGSNPDVVPFQICPQQTEMMYSNMETSTSQSQRSSQN